ncbi:RagB/SusD family nutrient uptake outer membrane protein [Myroides odoratimimus]|uniref:RagB/SusD family nutrient uptake outer membrane protein n=1 Tax=Myroides odoratimimus TaxID=76832 RepID=UPI00046897D1|nr:RagB/SusD family nutrient uptake outer membrane protein [Myroides odoratimimus]
MKINFIKYIALASVLTLGSCSNDYLETNPTDQTNPETIYATTAGIEMAVNGLAKIMVSQQLQSQGFNGEGTIKMYYGEYSGNNFRVNLPGWATIINGQLFNDSNSIYDYYPWHYYYMIISNANAILDHVDVAEGTEVERKYLKAQALSYRAYSYTMLSQIYGNRWQDTNNGAQECLVLRTSSKDPETLPLVSLNKIYAGIYSDLDEAIKLFESSEYVRKADHNYKIDANVAKAIYARAALIKQDYSTAAKYAEEAIEGYPLMSNDQYLKSGFANPTSEWIWSSFGGSAEQLYFFAYHAFIGYNSSASQVRSFPKRISKELFNQIPDTDFRKSLFLDPKGFDGQYSVDTGEVLLNDDKELYPLDAAARKAWPELQKNAKVAAYMQFKIKANDMPGVGHLNHFRSAEMYFIGAEAQYFLGNEAAAKALLTEVNQKRDPSYNVTVSGEDLFKEIRVYKGLELWGEGFDWFDMKRWNLDIVRLSGSNGGNYPESLTTPIRANASHKWTWTTPAREVDYRTELPQ